MDRLNGLPPLRGYIFESYAGTYFTPEKCERMDAIREGIAALASGREVSGDERDALLASFLLAADRVANTLGQYDAFLKHIDGEIMANGRHLLDGRVRTPFCLRMLKPFEGAGIEVLQGDMLDLARELDCEVAYYDPPYNGRQYCDNYHVLENLARWTKPPLFGKTRKFDRAGMRSPFSLRSQADSALDRLIASTRAPRVFLSYGSEGILTKERIMEVLGRYGKAVSFELPYPVFGNGAGVSKRRTVTEYLFLLERGDSGWGDRSASC
jgi:adenine-specific DNA-methyltransferase